MLLGDLSKPLFRSLVSSVNNNLVNIVYIHICVDRIYVKASNCIDLIFTNVVCNDSLYSDTYFTTTNYILWHAVKLICPKEVIEWKPLKLGGKVACQTLPWRVPVYIAVYIPVYIPVYTDSVIAPPEKIDINYIVRYDFKKERLMDG